MSQSRVGGRDLPRAVIFDMDGLLIDSEPAWRDGFRYGVAAFMRHHGLPVPSLTDADLATYEGGRVDQTLAALHLHLTGAPLPNEERQRLTASVVAHVADLFRANPTPITSSVQALRDVADLGIPVAIATSSAPLFLDAVLDTLDLAHLVQVRQSALVLTNGKPHPEVYLRAMAALAVEPHDCIAVEDSFTGLEAAVRAGLPTVWFTHHTEAHGSAVLRERTGHLPGVPPTRISAYREVTGDAIVSTWRRYRSTPRRARC